MNKSAINEVLEMLKQLQVDCGSRDDYGQGLYNGLELARIQLLGRQNSKFMGAKEWKNRKWDYIVIYSTENIGK